MKEFNFKGLVPILSPGHGGMVNGVYTTEGKRSPDWHRGVLYEGAFNRWIVNQLIQELDYEKLPYMHAFPEFYEKSPMQTLIKKRDRANEWYKTNKNLYMLEIHANAGGGTGIEGFTSRGFTNSDPVCEIFMNDLEDRLKKTVFRKDTRDGDSDKEAGFFILRKTNCPCVLLELGFMDHLDRKSVV